MAYDYLVVATGATHTYFGNDEREAHAPGLETVDDALEIRRRFMLAFEVRTGAMVTHIDGHGVQASPLARSLGAGLDRASRVHVDEDLSVPGRPEVFVIGDLAHKEQDGAMLPGVARVALQGGRHVARPIRTHLPMASTRVDTVSPADPLWCCRSSRPQRATSPGLKEICA